MRKSREVSLILLPTLAATLLAGCTNPKHCVDKDDKVVEEEKCKDVPDGAQRSASTPYIWYYGGGGNYSPGQTVNGGSYTPTPGKAYATPARGGFGQTGRSIGGGGVS